MRNLKLRVTKALSNECGGPNVEQIIGIGIAVSVGVGLYLVGNAMYKWLAGDDGADKVIEGLEKSAPGSVVG